MSKFYLKDWHGKEKEFTDEKIFVRGENGELIQFTKGEGAVVQPLEVTESGTYTAPDGVDGYSPVSVNVPTPEIKLQEKTITENGEYTADEGFDGLAKVLVEVAGGGSNVVAKYGTLYGATSNKNGGKITVTHNLGVVPDIIIIMPYNSPLNTSGDGLISYFGDRKKELYDNYSLISYRTSGNVQASSYSYPFTDNTNTDRSADLATETTFVTPNLIKAQNYCWFVIGGLYNE